VSGLAAVFLLQGCLLCLYRSEYLSGKFDSVGCEGYTEYLMFLAEWPAASVWTCQVDTVSVHWTKLSYVGMVTSHDLLFVGYYDIARSLYNS
jgi:hypothetical protein